MGEVDQLTNDSKRVAVGDIISVGVSGMGNEDHRGHTPVMINNKQC